MNNESAKFDTAWTSERAEYFEGLYQEIRTLKDEGVFDGKRIAIVGVWTNAADINKIICRLSLSVSIIADNNPNKHGLSRIGIISQSVESLVNENNIVILSLNNLYWQEIHNQLIGLGFAKDGDFFTLFGGDKFELMWRSEQTLSVITNRLWNKKCADAQRGYEIYLDITEKYPGLPIWCMHQPSIGDMYIFSLFLPVAMGVSTVTDCECVLIVAKNSTKKLAEAIGYKNIVLVSFDEAHHNMLSVMKLLGDKLNIHNAVYHGLNALFQSLVWNTQVTFRDSFTKYVFHFEKEVVPVYPQFPKRSDLVKAEFARLKLKEGKTVIISPYAGHFEATISQAHWQKLTDNLTAKGYAICTNCGGPDEHALPGTVPAFIELQDCVEFAETAGHFIGIRSGFCDLLCNAICKRVVIYETGAPAASIDYFGFESMGIGDGNIIEIINDCIHTDELMDAVASYF